MPGAKFADEFKDVAAICRLLLVYPSGFNAWLREPLNRRPLEDQRQTVLQAWDESGEVYGYRNLHDDLCDMGEDIGTSRARRLARLAGIRGPIGYKKEARLLWWQPRRRGRQHLESSRCA